MPNDDLKVTYIEIRYSDGSSGIAEGDAADQIMKWYNAAESLACIHGARYNGPKFTKREA